MQANANFWAWKTPYFYQQIEHFRISYSFTSCKFSWEKVRKLEANLESLFAKGTLRFAEESQRVGAPWDWLQEFQCDSITT